MCVCVCVCVCVCFMTGAPKGSTESISEEAGVRTCDPRFTRHSTYPLHHIHVPCANQSPLSDWLIFRVRLRSCRGLHNQLKN